MPQLFNNCEVTRAGPSSDGDRVLVALSDRSGAFDDRWFEVAQSVRREVLAVALTAITIGGRVEALIDDGAPEFATLYVLYVAVRPRQVPRPPAWSGDWESLGGACTSGPGVCSWAPGRIDVFVRGTDDALYHKYFDNNAWSGDWESLGGACTSGPGVCSWAPGRIDVFVRGTDDALYHKYFDGGLDP